MFCFEQAMDLCHPKWTTAVTLQIFWLEYAENTIFAVAMFVENLIKLGLSEKEATVYLLLLGIGPSQVSSLAKRAMLKRVTAYSVLDSLCARGLVTFEPMKIGKRYIAYDPECLLNGLEQEKAQLKWRMELAKDCIQKLNSPFLQEYPALS